MKHGILALFITARHHLKTILLALSVFSCFGSISQAAELDADVIINLDHSYAPYMYGEVDYPLGLYTVLIQATLQKMESKAKIQVVPWKRAVHMVESGQAGIGGLYMNDLRQKKYDFSRPIYTENLVIFTKQERKFPFKNIDDLKGKLVGLNLGWSYGSEIDTARAKGLFRVHEVRDNNHGLLMLSNARLDAIVIDKLSAAMILSKSNHAKELQQLPTPAAINHTYIAFHKSSKMKPFLDRFDNAFILLKKDGSFARIVNRFIQQKPPSS